MSEADITIKACSKKDRMLVRSRLKTADFPGGDAHWTSLCEDRRQGRWLPEGGRRWTRQSTWRGQRLPATGDHPRAETRGAGEPPALLHWRPAARLRLGAGLHSPARALGRTARGAGCQALSH